MRFILKDNEQKLSELQLDMNMNEFSEFYREMEKINSMI
jgi:hypothetical protein